jgi:hypothetical protein
MLAAVPRGGTERLRGICLLCVRHLDVTGAGISMVTSTGNRGVVCATDDTSARIEDLQFSLGEGPCVDAVHAGAPVLIGDLLQSSDQSSDQPHDLAVERWPAFMDGAAEAGVRAVFSFPLRIGAIKIGAMDLYRARAGELVRADLRRALVAADTSALEMLALDPAHGGTFDGDAAARSTYQLQVHQATGMVQTQLAVSTSEAFAVLRARAFAETRPLEAVAMDVVERRLLFTPGDV